MSLALTMKREQMTWIRNPKAGLVRNTLWGMIEQGAGYYPGPHSVSRDGRMTKS